VDGRCGMPGVGVSSYKEALFRFRIPAAAAAAAASGAIQRASAPDSAQTASAEGGSRLACTSLASMLVSRKAQTVRKWSGTLSLFRRAFGLRKGLDSFGACIVEVFGETFFRASPSAAISAPSPPALDVRFRFLGRVGIDDVDSGVLRTVWESAEAPGPGSVLMGCERGKRGKSRKDANKACKKIHFYQFEGGAL
jgi:hypothetical protein